MALENSITGMDMDVVAVAIIGEILQRIIVRELLDKVQ